MRKPDTPCVGCGKLLWTGKGTLPAGKRTCRSCRQISPVPYKPRRPCAHCGHPVKESDHVYCSRACASRGRRQSPISRSCQWCGAEFNIDTKNNKQVYCSRSCGGQARGDPFRKWPSSRIYIVKCLGCDKSFVSRRRGKAVCNYKCQKAKTVRRYREDPAFRDSVITRAHEHRAHALGLGDTKVTLTYLIERDVGRCRAVVCHFRSRKVAVLGTRGPRQPTMDHIVPLSLGGTHTLDNVVLAHYRCNLSKGNRGGGEQLLLIG